MDLQFPDQRGSRTPPGPAVLILNDHDTGYPFACLESSIISATRTAASAALAADWLSRGRTRPARVGFFGTGLIARYVHTFLAGTGWSFDSVGVYDVSPDSADGFCGYLQEAGAAGQTAQVTVHDNAEDLIRSSDLVVFAPSPENPMSPTLPGSHTTLWSSTSHCATSLPRSCSTPPTSSTTSSTASRPTPPRTWRSSSQASRDFLDGTLDDVMTGRVTPPADRPVIFSPFGLGVLDLAVGNYVYDEVALAGHLHLIDHFFHELRRYG